MSGNDADPWTHPVPQVAGEHLLETLEDRKDGIRAATRRRRKQADARTRAEVETGIAEQVAAVITDLGLAAGDVVACYVSRPEEPGTAATLELLRAHGLRVLLPLLGATLERDWGVYTGPDALAQRAPARPLEPAEHAGGADVISEARLVLVPALQVDESGYRLGQGGGWYDRVLRHANPHATILAVVHDDEAEVPALPRAQHDLPVGGVLTPSRWWRIAPVPAPASASAPN